MKNNKGFAQVLVIGIVLGVLVVGGVAYYAGKSSNPAPQNVPQENIINNSGSNSDSTEASIKLLSPNGGEKWKKGDKVKILWTGGKDIKTVNIRLNIQGDGEGQHFSASIASNVPNTGSYEWIVKELYAEVLGITDLPTSNKYYVEIGGKSGGLFTITSSFTITTDDIINWKTYSDSQYGFEFKYPNTYILTETNLGVRIQSSLSCKTIGEGGVWPKDCFSYDLSIQKNKILAEGIGIIKKTIEVAGYSAEKIQFADSEGMYEQSSQTLVQFKKGNDWYINTFSFNSENKVTSENLLNLILTTFKFN